MTEEVAALSEITPIAHINTLFPSKFGIPRQSGLTETTAKIVFEKPYRTPEAIRGLSDFSHIWLIWEFSENKDKSNSLTVRPPRLGGNKRMGVFATRSPYRPNNLGLSCVEIEKIEENTPEGPVIYVKGADILDGTPIFDIKPYLPFTDSKPEAKGGFAAAVYGDCLEVVFTEESLKNIKEEDIPALTELLSQDPRPHYHGDERLYSFEFSRYKIKFRVQDNTLNVTDIENI